jgi:hypothetical protein
MVNFLLLKRGNKIVLMAILAVAEIRNNDVVVLAFSRFPLMRLEKNSHFDVSNYVKSMG